MHMPAELKQAIDAARGAPVEITDGEQHYFVVHAEVFERLKGLFETNALSEAETATLLRAAGQRAGWDDPAMDIYNDLDPRRSE